MCRQNDQIGGIGGGSCQKYYQNGSICGGSWRQEDHDDGMCWGSCRHNDHVGCIYVETLPIRSLSAQSGYLVSVVPVLGTKMNKL